ncbi:MAG TPA: lysine biosynthesis protein LysX [Nitrososphaerales archaeon]|nr:lysine biosynthesis protein LysX [Nitrososphaerales archaeon]
MKLAITFDRLRIEEKELKREAEKAGCKSELIDVRKLAFNVTGKRVRNGFGDVVLQRCISYYRSAFLTRILENFGIQVINTTKVSEACGNKLVTSMLLAKAGVQTPKTYVALSSESVFETAEKMGYPVVVKPFTGSWGRMVDIAKEPQTLGTIVEYRESMQSPVEHMYYIQEYVKRPPRDIRLIVAGDEVIASVYRNAPKGEWRTNVARGGTTTAFKLNKEIEDITLRAAKAVGGGILGVDAMESKDQGYTIHEVNNTVEFKGAQAATEHRIAKKIVEYVIREAKR